MKHVLIILKVVGILVVVVAGSAVTYLYAKKPAMVPPANLTIERTAARIERGKYLFNLADCDGCHSERDFSHFDGPVVEGRRGVGNVFPKEMGLPGVVAPPNITPDLETGIGSWTDGEKVRAIREGVDKSGRTLFPMMPYENFRHMSDEDVYSLVAYLDELPPVKNALPQTQLNFPVSLLVKSAPQPVDSVPAPDMHDKRKYGEYLVTVAGCRDCHTPSLSGGQKFQFGSGIVLSANISPDLHTGTGRWSEDNFVDRFAQYREYVQNGSPHAGPTSFTVMPWLNLAQLPDNDLRAIYSFIRTQPAVYNGVETHPAPEIGKQ